MNVIKFIVGDYLYTGHNITDEFYFITTASEDDILKAYQKAVELTGVDLIKDYCKNYGENFIPDVVIDSIKKYTDLYEIEMDGPYEGEYNIWSHGWMFLILAMIRIGNPEINMEQVIADFKIDTGGYGLFFS